MEKLTPQNTTSFIFKMLAVFAIIIALFMFVGELADHLSVRMTIAVLVVIAFGGGILARFADRRSD